MIKITAVDPQDLLAILRIERLGFNEAEAGTAAWSRDWLQSAAGHRKTGNSKPAASHRADLFTGSRAIL